MEIKLECRKVDNLEEEGSRYFGDALEGKCFKVGGKNDIRERVFQFTAKTIPIPRLQIPRMHTKINRKRL